jgi:hypothetical protein
MKNLPIQGARCPSNNSRSAPGGAGRRRPGKLGHDLAQDRGVIFGLCLARRPLDAEPGQVAAQACKRALVQEPRQVV